MPTMNLPVVRGKNKIQREVIKINDVRGVIRTATDAYGTFDTLMTATYVDTGDARILVLVPFGALNVVVKYFNEGKLRDGWYWNSPEYTIPVCGLLS